MANSTLAPAPAPAPHAAPEGRSKKKLIIIVVGALVVAALGYYMLVMKPAASAAAAASPPKPTPGAVLKLDAIYINLASGHFLKLGIALQGTASAPKDLDGSQALDEAITTFSGQEMTALADTTSREDLKNKLIKKVVADYPDGQVMGLYFTEFVMQ
jgi:flagellar FliL protein